MDTIYYLPGMILLVCGLPLIAVLMWIQEFLEAHEEQRNRTGEDKQTND